MLTSNPSTHKPQPLEREQIIFAYLALSPEQRDVLRIFVDGIKAGKPLVGTYDAIFAHPKMPDKDFSQALNILRMCLDAKLWE